MGGKRESIWIEKGRNKVIFDMMIPTPTRKGMMYAMPFARCTEVAGDGNENDDGHETVEFKDAEKDRLQGELDQAWWNVHYCTRQWNYKR